MTDQTQVTPIATGLESDVYQIAIGGIDLVLKVRHPDGKQQYEFEAFAYTNMAMEGAMVPQVMYVDDDSLVMTQLAGDEMDDPSELFHDQGLFASAAADLVRCHDIKLPGFGTATKMNASFVGINGSWRDYLDSMKQTLDSLVPVGTLSDTDIQLLKSFWSSTLPYMTLEEGSLIHGDFAMSAIFVDDTTYTGIIDFGDAFIGDPLMDLAYFRFKEVTKPYGQDIYDLLVDEYRKTADRLIDEKPILFYMVYWGLQRLSHCPDEILRAKFGDKLHVVADLIQNHTKIVA